MKPDADADAGVVSGVVSDWLSGSPDWQSQTARVWVWQNAAYFFLGGGTHGDTLLNQKQLQMASENAGDDLDTPSGVSSPTTKTLRRTMSTTLAWAEPC